MKKIMLIIFVYISVLLLFSCEKREVYEAMSFNYFDTVSYIYSYGDETKNDFNNNVREIFKIFEKYHKLLDIYNEYEGMNNLCIINKNAGKNFVEVEQDLIDFLLYCKYIYKITNGETNIMLGSVLNIWHEARKKKEEVNINLLEEASLYTNIEYLEIDQELNRVRIGEANARIDVGAIAKGYVCEKVAEYLSKNNYTSYVLNLGGNVKMIGCKKDGGMWKTGIKDPKDISKVKVSLNLSNTSCVTSGDYERYYETDGKKYHHIIDKDTLFPANYFSSVTIICEDSGLADALSTALFCMDYNEGYNLIKQIGGIEVIWIDKNNDVFYTEGLDLKVYE